MLCQPVGHAGPERGVGQHRSGTEPGGAGESELADVESEEPGRAEMNRGSHMENIKGTAANARRVAGGQLPGDRQDR